MSELTSTGFNGFGVDDYADAYDEFMEIMDWLNQERDDLVADIKRMLLQERVIPEAFTEDDIQQFINEFANPTAQDVLDLALKMASDDQLFDIGRIIQEDGK